MKKLLFRIKNRIFKILKIEAKNTRAHFISAITSEKSVLEIGPFCNPVCVGNNVKYFDILNQAELVERALEIGYKITPDQVPYIDYVSKTGDLSIINEKFDVVISCHAVEHQLDLIAHLQSVSNMLVEGGSYYLIIPDKRYCFDHYIAESTIAEVIHSFFEKKQAHSLKSVIEHRALTTHNYSMKHWNNDHGQRATMKNKIEAAIKEFGDAAGKNIDVHAWYFTPNSFVDIINLLHSLKYINLSVKKIIPTRYGNLEFYVVLENSGTNSKSNS